jgi:hypothetical protein
MRHVPDGVLRRLLDEPLSVPDAARQHLSACGRCRAGSGRIGENAALASRLVASPAATARETTSTDLAWARLQTRLAEPGPAPRTEVKVPRYLPRRITSVPAYAGVTLGAGLVAGGVAAAATLTTVFAPTQVAPLPVSASDLSAVETVMGVGTGSGPGGLPFKSGSERLAFGTLTWTSGGQPRRVSSISAAEALTRLAFTSPATLPSGVGSMRGIAVQPAVTATIRFSPDEGQPVGGTSLTVTAGPVMLVQYGGDSSGSSLTTLAIATMRRPVATSTGATAGQLEDFLLSRPGMPAGLASEIRLLGDPGSVLPVPVPQGVAAQHVQVDGAPAVLMSVGSGVATGVIWESGGTIHAVAGLLDSADILNVARQIG